MVPTFNFAMAFGMITSKASKRFDFNTATWIEGGPFTAKDYYTDVQYDMTITGDIVDAYAAHHWMNNIARTTYVLIFLFWYLDHTLASNRGTSYPFYFTVQPSYWKSVFNGCFKKNSKKVEEGQRLKRKIQEKDLGISADQIETLDSV